MGTKRVAVTSAAAAIAALANQLASEQHLPPPKSGFRFTSGPTMRRRVPKVGRNAECPCGSKRKYKHCCIGKYDVVEGTFVSARNQNGN